MKDTSRVMAMGFNSLDDYKNARFHHRRRARPLDADHMRNHDLPELERLLRGAAELLHPSVRPRDMDAFVRENVYEAFETRQENGIWHASFVDPSLQRRFYDRHRAPEHRIFDWLLGKGCENLCEPLVVRIGGCPDGVQKCGGDAWDDPEVFRRTNEADFECRERPWRAELQIALQEEFNDLKVDKVSEALNKYPQFWTAVIHVNFATGTGYALNGAHLVDGEIVERKEWRDKLVYPIGSIRRPKIRIWSLDELPPALPVREEVRRCL